MCNLFVVNMDTANSVAQDCYCAIPCTAAHQDEAMQTLPLTMLYSALHILYAEHAISASDSWRSRGTCCAAHCKEIFVAAVHYKQTS